MEILVISDKIVDIIYTPSIEKRLTDIDRELNEWKVVKTETDPGSINI